ncbi:MAG: xylulokinase [Pseudonocardiales bacterium]|nr:xylB [Jatrophihabitans sp.]MDT4902258.1 xylulokinase [Pseudonocardiales bacterium]MDT4931478.1 xylulokinase [Pseudonocardiales bacterium]
MTLVAGIDSSTQSCKVVVRDADTGALVRSGTAAHPDGTEVDPERWWSALQIALAGAGGVDDVAAIAVGAQQHGLVGLDEQGSVVRDALLWNDTRSAGAADDLVAELPDSAAGWARQTGSVPLANFTVTKLRWLATHEPENAARTAAVCLPHDWLTWRLRGSTDITALTTDRGDASGTGYWSPAEERYVPELLRLAMGQEPLVPTVLGPSASPGHTTGGARLAAGTGDNAAAALGVGATSGDVIVSIGTSGVVSAVSDTPTADPTAIISGFADATGRYLPLVCTLNAARVLSATATILGVTLDELSRLALAARPGSDGLVLVPYLEGERTPNKPDATGALHGLQLRNSTPAHVARATVEGLLCGLADGLDALRDKGIAVNRVLLVGGGARSEAVRRIAPTVLGVPVAVPPPAEYVADGAARQAAWMLSGEPEPPSWTTGSAERFEAPAQPAIRARYAEVQNLTANRL